MTSLTLNSRLPRKSIDWHMKVARLYCLKWTMKEIAAHLRVDIEVVTYSIAVYSEITGWYTDSVVGVQFGNKQEAYQTEKEAIKGYKPPKYSELSKEERAIYKSL